MLNKEQLEASEIQDERVLVLAGPGTGKCAKDNRGFTYVTKNSDKINVFTCTAIKTDDDNNEETVDLPTN